MQMTGEQRISAPRAKVWAALNDPEVLRQCIPGCQSLEKEADDTLKALVNIKIGPISARFQGKVMLSDLNPPNSYTISGEGQGGTAGFAKGQAKVKLADDGDATLLSYDVDAQVGGRMAQLGGAVIDATAKQLAASFFKRFGEVVAPPPETAAAPVATRSAAQSSAVSADANAQAPSLPIAWVLALLAAALAGFLIGGGGDDGVLAGVAMCALIVVVAGAGYEFGRRSAPVIVLDKAALDRLTGKSP
jgi:carbon monoxide dehydrogenase subunit G